NTAAGAFALSGNASGSANTALGFDALLGNSGSFNTAVGDSALESNSGSSGTAVGVQALAHNTANGNTATGYQALTTNSSGNSNTADGTSALARNTTGSSNTATGIAALFANTSGNNNTANGADALFNNTQGVENTATGVNALLSNTTGSDNTAVGALAGQNLTTGNNNIDIGANVLGVAGESSKIRIGKQGTQNGTFIAGIFGVAISGSTVVVNSNGKLGVATSSARFKEAIKRMDRASEAILGLKPVSFRYKEEIDPDRTPQFGLIAEEVEKVNPDLVGRDQNGEVNTVRYE